MQTILVRDGEVRCVLLGVADEAAKRRAVFGSGGAANTAVGAESVVGAEPDLAAEGEWHTLPANAPAGEGWAWNGTACIPPAPTQADYGRVIGEHIHAVARSRGYDDGVSLASYDNDPNPVFSGEATAFKAWRSAVWVFVAQRMAEVQAGAAAPSLSGIVAELPAMEWPA
jgi:hypothetical protein